MAKTPHATPEAYLATLTNQQREALEKVRAAIRKAVPKAEEVISYNIPAFKQDGSWIFYYSAHTKHFALNCPPPSGIYEAFKHELASYKQSKSGMQIPLDQPVPTALITKMAKYRAKEMAEMAKLKPAKKK